MNIKYTLGPWAIVKDGACSLIYGEGGVGEKVAHCYNGHRMDPHLIATAPELLAALKYVRPALASCSSQAISASELADLDRIIAKAEGKS